MISICIPAYEQGEGHATLEKLLQSIQMQSFKEYEICVSDNSGTFQDLCIKYGARWQHNNKTFGVSANTNAAIDMATYDCIKIMYQDDWFITDCLHEFITDTWKVSASTHYFESGKRINQYPDFIRTMSTETNCLGMPSVISFNKCKVRFNEDLKMVLDLDFYFQLFNIYGQPKIIKGHNIAQRIWNKQQSYLLRGIKEKIPTLVKKYYMKLTLNPKYIGGLAVVGQHNIKLTNNITKAELEILYDKQPHLVIAEVTIEKKSQDHSKALNTPTTLTLIEQPKEENNSSEALPKQELKQKGRKPKMAKN